MSSTAVVAAMAAVFSVGGAAVWSELRKALAGRSTSKRANTKDLVAGLNTEVQRLTTRSDTIEASKNAEIAEYKRQLAIEQGNTSYWRERSGRQDYLLAKNNIPFDPPSFTRKAELDAEH